jgi:hypothetical protein
MKRIQKNLNLEELSIYGNYCRSLSQIGSALSFKKISVFDLLNCHPIINYILARKGETYESVLHWYQSAGNKVLSTGIQQNIERFIGRTFYNRNDRAFIRVSVFGKEEHLNEANSLAKLFAGKILDLLPNYWPIEQ